MEKLKADLHLHTAEDPYDLIRWDARRLIDEGARKGFRVLAITNHLTVCYSRELAEYAARRDILLIPGCEGLVGRRHILLLNPTPEAAACRNFDELRTQRRKNHPMAVIAPHPFYPSPASLRGWLYRYSDVFDAVEWCSFYFKWLNFNCFGKRASRILDLPMVGSSDCHYPWQFGTTYSIIEAEPTVEGVIEAIRAGRCRVETRPFKLNNFTFQFVLRGLGVGEQFLWGKDWSPDRELWEIQSGV